MSIAANLTILETTDYSVSNGLFGGNVIGGVNDVPRVDEEGSTSYFQQAISNLNVTHLRYPAGQAQSVDITNLVNGELNKELKDFVAWCQSSGTEFTLVIPVADKLASQSEMNSFVALVYNELGDSGDLLRAFEIGNEYWGDSDEVSYGQDAAEASVSLQNGITDYNNIHSGVDLDPEILVQTSSPINSSMFFIPNPETNFEAYKEWVNKYEHVIKSEISDWSSYFNFSTTDNIRIPTYDQRINLANQVIIQQFDADGDLSNNGLQPTVASNAIDGIVAHYYFNTTYNGQNDWFTNSLQESRRLDIRDNEWDHYFYNELSYHVTEWNVRSLNYEQQGLKAASVLLEQFQMMLESGVDIAATWPIRHNISNALSGGNTEYESARLSPAGTVFQWMSESLVTPEGAGLTLLELSGLPDGNVEINAYQDFYRTVLYVSSRTDEFALKTILDLEALFEGAYSWSARQLGISESSSDGFSYQEALDENGDLIGGTRLERRTISDVEKEALIELFDGILTIKEICNSENKTWLPPIEGILLRPNVTNPTSLSDFYFSNESDVLSDVKIVTLDDLSNTSLVLDPYEVVEITINTIRTTVGTHESDTLEGGYGADSMDGGSGNDILNGNGGNDFLYGGMGHDVLYGGGGDDQLSSGGGNDTIYSGHGNDTIWAGGGDDVLYGGDGDNKMIGGSGDDRFVAGSGENRIFGGSGIDALSYEALNVGITARLDVGEITHNGVTDSVVSIESFIGTNFSDNVRGYIFQGNADLLGGNDEIHITVTNLDNEISIDEVVFHVNGGAGEDTISFINSEASISIWQDVGLVETAQGYISFESFESFIASDFDDTILGLQYINGSFLNGQFYGMGGNDIIRVGADDSTFVDGGSGNDFIEVLFGSSTVSGGDGNDMILGINAQINVDGGDGNDLIFGGSAVDRIEGGSGDDRLSGGAGADVFIFGADSGLDVILDFDIALDELILPIISQENFIVAENDDGAVLWMDDINRIEFIGINELDLSTFLSSIE